jgi:MscS family membrane protein
VPNFVLKNISIEQGQSKMEAFQSQFSGYIESLNSKDQLWIVEAFGIVLLTLVLAYVAGRLLSSAEKRAEATSTLWDDALVFSLRRPAKWLIWVFGLASAADVAGNHSPSVILQSVEHIRYLGCVLIASWFLVDLIKRVEGNLMDPKYSAKPMDRTTAVAIGKLLRASVFITGILIILQYFNVQISGILAFGGIGGIAVGFAARDLLANFFGGLMIYLDRPFAVGDWVRSPDKEIEGTVEDIGWRLTRIRTFDKRPLYVPNSIFAQIALENPSRMLNRRIYETVGIRYDDAAKMDSIVRDVKAMLENHQEIDTTQTLMVNFNTFSNSSLDFFIYCFTKTTVWQDFHVIKQDVLLQVLNIIASHDAECAFPTSTVHLPDGVNLVGSTKE